jgi:DNA segregation ATPase FtsK/SpoIIIE, S-DNA-T family
VLVQNLLLEICATNAPSLAQVHLIDPKHGLDYPWMEHMPHLDGGVVTEQEVAKEILATLVGEMNERYQRMRTAGANKLSDYNRKVAPGERLPVVWLVHDEFAEWMLDDDYRSAVTTSVSQLGIMARAAGIHLVFIAQRPDKAVFPMQLRSNLGNRLILRVEDKGTSEIALGEAGAERLLGKGHVAARLGGEPGPILGQVPFLDMDRIEEVAAIIARCTA